ncbi:DUF6192 family protein [Embleya sp. NPDC127516]|uniref:DUF6192 family protein n=1 Tax=Embleya sp. NPDC127516 TaxID=3363990 RepID=UPI00381130E2
MAEAPDVAMDSRLWKRYVKEGRAFAHEESGAQFGLGDIALEIVPRGTTAKAPFRILHTYAEDVGVDAEQLELYRRVSAAWPKSRRDSHACWTVHELFSLRDDRYELIRTPPVYKRTGERRWTCDGARRALGKSAGRPSTVDERATAAMKYLRDDKVVRRVMHDDHIATNAARAAMTRPEVAHRMAADPQVRKSLRRADAEREAQLEQAVRDRNPALRGMEHGVLVMDLVGYCQRFVASINKTLDDIAGNPLNARERTVVEQQLDRVDAASTFCRSVLATGDTSMDEQLERILRGEEP